MATANRERHMTERPGWFARLFCIARFRAWRAADAAMCAEIRQETDACERAETLAADARKRLGRAMTARSRGGGGLRIGGEDLGEASAWWVPCVTGSGSGSSTDLPLPRAHRSPQARALARRGGAPPARRRVRDRRGPAQVVRRRRGQAAAAQPRRADRTPSAVGPCRVPRKPCCPTCGPRCSW